MRLSQLHGSYDAIFSLGDLCLASIQLQKNNLRPYSGVLDWMGSTDLTAVSRLLMNRFEGFMDYENLRVIGDADEKNLLVREERYNIFSNHDFPKDSNTAANLASYPEVKQRFERRITRFLERMEHSRRILFIRTEGDVQGIYDLQEVLNGLVCNEFRILVVNHAPCKGMLELDWPLDEVCALKFPNEEKWEGNNHLWKQVLSGIKLGI